MTSSTTWTISQLAEEFGITPRTIRFYEDEAILSPTRRGNRRVYTARDRAHLKMAVRGRRLGLSLAEIRDLIGMYASPQDGRRQLERYLQVLREHRRMLEQKREDIEQTLAEIDEQETQCLRLLARSSEASSAA
ncbi:MerR family DNA-binding transcriptional regulator [Verticiella sediminum]|uniref:MerR family DNA-binding transcriptional regulator n=1 Tax=Verticiella sediminum TaxID=1247510 RepID=A0A556B1X2_9BURK|nr:MerR family DNA-binding transcriptional regulator [Verticiella sediminum]TSH99169.1 MerR family DNA-binding transcriptional regulator [Verticiella sediminum]